MKWKREQKGKKRASKKKNKLIYPIVMIIKQVPHYAMHKKKNSRN